MTSSRPKALGCTLLISLLLAFGCHKNVASNPPPPPPPAPPAPASTGADDYAARSTGHHRSWRLNDAGVAGTKRDKRYNHSGIGDVAATGNRSVNPTSSVTYTATAMGPGGSATDTARITVNIPAAAAADRVPERPRATVSAIDAFNENVKTVYFEYDKADISPEQMSLFFRVMPTG